MFGEEMASSRLGHLGSIGSAWCDLLCVYVDKKARLFSRSQVNRTLTECLFSGWISLQRRNCFPGYSQEEHACMMSSMSFLNQHIHTHSIAPCFIWARPCFPPGHQSHYSGVAKQCQNTWPLHLHGKVHFLSPRAIWKQQRIIVNTNAIWPIFLNEVNE